MDVYIAAILMHSIDIYGYYAGPNAETATIRRSLTVEAYGGGSRIYTSHIKKVFRQICGGWLKRRSSEIFGGKLRIFFGEIDEIQISLISPLKKLKWRPCFPADYQVLCSYKPYLKYALNTLLFQFVLRTMAMPKCKSCTIHLIWYDLCQAI